MHSSWVQPALVPDAFLDAIALSEGDGILPAGRSIPLGDNRGLLGWSLLLNLLFSLSSAAGCGARGGGAPYGAGPLGVKGARGRGGRGQGNRRYIPESHVNALGDNHRGLLGWSLLLEPPLQPQQCRP